VGEISILTRYGEVAITDAFVEASTIKLDKIDMRCRSVSMLGLDEDHKVRASAQVYD